MKGFIVVNRINDVYFLDFDKEFTNHTNKQAKEHGLLQPDDNEDELDPNIIMQLFSPLFMSQWFLIEQQKNPCSSITCENGFIFVFKQHEDFLIVAISVNGYCTEQVLHKKINIFIRMLEFLYGPVTDEIGYSQFCRKSERWKFLQEVLATWETLRLEEHSFLVEAIERLHVNQLVNEKCMELLENAANKLQNAGEKNTQHTLLVVNSKLLSLFSNRNAPSLQESDTLCIILLVKLLFPSDEKLEDLFSCSYRKSDGDTSEDSKSPATVRITSPVDKYESALEGDDSGDDQDQYMSASEMPLTKTAIPENPYPAVSEQPNEEISTSEQDLFTFPENQQGEQRNRAESNGRQRSRTLENVHVGRERTLSGRVTPGAGRARSRSLIETVGKVTGPEKENQSQSIDTETLPTVPQQSKTNHYHISLTAFLTTEMCQYSPYQLHFIQIFPGMVLVLLTEIPRSIHANSLCQLIRLLKDLISGRKDQVQRAQGHVLYDIINMLLDKLAGAMKRSKRYIFLANLSEVGESLCCWFCVGFRFRRFIEGKLEIILEDIKRKWDNPEFKNSLIGYLEQGTGSEIPPSTERSLGALQKKVKELFLYLYLYPYEITPAVEQVVTFLREKARNRLWDFKDYLSVKAQRNIVMTSYFDALPGLVHFIYIDRRTNQLTAPSLNIVSKDATETDATQYLKDKIWRITEWIHCKLMMGVTMVTAREGDYYYSYHLWFEDFQGKTLNVQHPFLAGDIPTPPGILSGNFYKLLKRHCFPNVVPGSINCYELIMMHVGFVNTHYIAGHRKKLASMFYEAAGDNPMSLGF